MDRKNRHERHITVCGCLYFYCYVKVNPHIVPFISSSQSNAADCSHTPMPGLFKSLENSITMDLRYRSVFVLLRVFSVS